LHSGGSKPKLLCSERTSPRTATSEEVTSNAQIAILHYEQQVSDSDPPPHRAGWIPDFDDLIWIRMKHLPYRDRAKEGIHSLNSTAKPLHRHLRLVYRHLEGAVEAAATRSARVTTQRCTIDRSASNQGDQHGLGK